MMGVHKVMAKIEAERRPDFCLVIMDVGGVAYAVRRGLFNADPIRFSDQGARHYARQQMALYNGASPIKRSRPNSVVRVYLK